MANFCPSDPLISVIMAAYNTAETLVAALDSLSGQTYGNFVAYIVDDGSTDETWKILQEYAQRDTRFKPYRNTENSGLAASLNFCLEQITTPYVARMDADDIALAQRFERQLDFMERHPEIDVCGTWIDFFGEREGQHRTPTTHDAIAAELVFGNPIAHPTVMMRAAVLRANPYNPGQVRAQDYELWSRMLFDSNVHFANIPESLLRYRTHSSDFFRQWHIQVLRHNLERLGITPSDDELDLHTALSLRMGADIRKKYTPLQVALWCNKIYAACQQPAKVSPSWLASIMQELFLFSLYGSPSIVVRAIKATQFIERNNFLFYFRCLKQYYIKNFRQNKTL